MSFAQNDAASFHPLPPRLTLATSAERQAVAKPLYSQVRDLLVREISVGKWGPGAALPNETSLAQTYGVSVGTIRRAVEGLEDMGVVARRQGRGTFVAGFGNAMKVERFSRLRLRPQGDALPAGRATLGCSRRPASLVESREFGIPGGEVQQISQAVIAGRATLGIETHIIPAGTPLRFDDALAAGRDFYQGLAENGVLVARAEETVSAMAAGDADSAALGVPTGEHLLQVERRSFTVDDRLVEVCTARYMAALVCYVS